jgi:hypothetical protein
MADVATQVDRRSPLPGPVPPKPWLVRLGGGYSLIFGIGFLLLLASAPFDVGSYSISGEPVSGPVFLRAAWLPFLSFGGLFLGIGIGLWRNRPWSRQLVMVFWCWAAVCMIGAALLGSSAISTADLVSGLAGVGLLAPIAGWYFYRKQNVVGYYDAIERLEREGSSYAAARAALGPTWWQRHWRWAAPALGIALATGLWGGTRAFRSTEVYQAALARARQDSVIVRELGEPVKDGWFPTGETNWDSKGGGSARITIRLSGPRGRGTLRVQATRVHSVWQFEVLSFTQGRSGTVTDLLSREERALAPTTEK